MEASSTGVDAFDFNERKMTRCSSLGKRFSLPKMSGHRRIVSGEGNAEVAWYTLSVRCYKNQTNYLQVNICSERPQDLLDFLNALRCDAKSLKKVTQLTAGQCCPGAFGAFRGYSCVCVTYV